MQGARLWPCDLEGIALRQKASACFPCALFVIMKAAERHSRAATIARQGDKLWGWVRAIAMPLFLRTLIVT